MDSYTVKEVEELINSMVRDIDKAAETLKQDNNDFAKAALIGMSSARNIVCNYLSKIKIMNDEG